MSGSCSGSYGFHYQSVVALRRREHVHALVVGELREPARVHRPAPRVLGLERLSAVAGVDDQERVAGVDALDGLLELEVREAVREEQARVIADRAHDLQVQEEKLRERAADERPAQAGWRRWF